MEHTQLIDDDALDRPIDPRRERSRSRAIGALVLLIVAAGVVAAFYLWNARTSAPPPQPAVVPAAPPAAAPSVAPQPSFGAAPSHPIEAVAPPASEPQAPLPAIADSDAALHDALGSLLGAGTFEQLFYPDRVVRRIVATVDNLPRSSLSTDIRPVKPAGGAFATLGPEGAKQIGLDNAARYAPYVDAFTAVDSRSLVALYVRFYPLFQQAYRDLGYPNGYFNDRLVEAIDNVLATPVMDGPVGLVQPKVLYEYADPSLQSLSAGQKVLLRMGPENAARVRAKLREIRALVTAKRPG
ncbi:MAG TPA: DUF3014 domain-containing protein [Casimicrobiaceae bacterium]|jgi:hypothetical protein